MFAILLYETGVIFLSFDSVGTVSHKGIHGFKFRH